MPLRRDDNSRNKKARAGRLGGLATVQRYGRAHMASIDRRGAEGLWKRYELRPAGTSDFALVRKSDGAVVAFLSGRPGRR